MPGMQLLQMVVVVKNGCVVEELTYQYATLSHKVREGPGLEAPKAGPLG